ncbi:putative TCP-1 chaperonin [Toxoplasma gondii MAS]|uniref:Putative TCP-1 chaperonin n=1 Tax=Toxoplasma gondii MAS TaxID=943118 RepID=A0A086PRG8_TOXGO|nr:putative TCP-1 chaperonin [Toxoplasma gondii MAS]
MVSIVNAKADVLRSTAALAANCNAAKGLQEVVKSNFGPHGTLKMLVGGAGQIKITKDGCVLLHEMQIQHPTASMIARAATAQDESTGDGTTSSVLLIGELLRQSERLVFEGVHPRLLCRGFDKARSKCLEVLDQLKVPVALSPLPDRELLHSVARTSLRTKLTADLAEKLTPDVVEAVCVIAKPGEAALDLFMIEILHMRHGLASETKLVKVRGMRVLSGQKLLRFRERLLLGATLQSNMQSSDGKARRLASFPETPLCQLSLPCDALRAARVKRRYMPI